jgi:hypothetical protein
MSKNFLMPAARNTATGQLIKSQQLSGRKFTESDMEEVNLLSESLAKGLALRLRQPWTAAPITYKSS